MKDDSFFRGIRGPVGSGKSVASCVEVFRRALMQEPNAKGIRRSRWGVIRNTGPQLKTTTIKTWLDWFPEDEYGPFRWGVPFTHHIMVGDLDLEVIFLALDDEADVRKLLSLELTGIWANEAREMPKAIIDACTMRVGRFPSMRDGGPSWYGMIADTNAPEDDHWWPIMAGDSPIPEFMPPEEALMLRKPEGWKFFNQPPAMIENKDDEGHVTGYEKNPEAENARHLTPTYYEKVITGKTRDWINVYVMNRLGTVSEGKPVYPQYVEETHKASEELPVFPGSMIWVGLDFGFYPAAVFAQQAARGRWYIIDEICPEDISTPEFARLIKAKLAKLLCNDKQQVKIYGDPTGDTRSKDTDAKSTTFQILAANGVQCYPAPTNDPTTRIETVQAVLNRMVDGSPGMLVSPKCKTVAKGFNGGYCYRQIGGSGSPRYEITPMKNKFSHPHDALQYLLLGAGEGRKLMAHDNKDGKPKQARTKWNLFGKKNRKRRRASI